MSRSKAQAEPDDIWTKLMKEKSNQQASPEEVETKSNAQTLNNHVIFIGDQNSGKSSLIQTFLKPTAGKDTKQSVAIEYNYARKTINNVKYVANFWEVGGDLLDFKYLEVPITKNNFFSSTVVICCDLSKPQNTIVSTLRCISAVRELLSKRLSELQSINVNDVNELKERAVGPLRSHADFARMRPTEVPIIIVANKHDCVKSLPTAERKAIFQILRFVAHYFGATLLSVSGSDTFLKDTYRNLINAIAFNSAIKPACETNVDKMVYITKGQDSYESIFSVSTATDNEGSSMSKNAKLVFNDTDFNTFFTAKGLAKDTWNRFTDHIANIFGEPDPLPTMSLKEGEMEVDNDDGEKKSNDNPFPENDIDEMREIKDKALIRFIQENERKQELIDKANETQN